MITGKNSLALPSNLRYALQKLARKYFNEGLNLFVFGSFARGDNRPSSDLDLGVEWHNQHKPAIFLQLYYDTQELPTIRKIDLVDFAQTGKLFSDIATLDKIYIYEKETDRMKKEALKKDFNNILSRWEEVLTQPKNDIVQDSAILRFELTFEVAWKLMQILTREHGYDINSPRQAFQQAFTIGWITDEEIWADIIKARNTAIYVYRQEYAEILYNRLMGYYNAFKELYDAIEQE